MAPSLRDDIVFVRVSISDPMFRKAQVNGASLWAGGACNAGLLGVDAADATERACIGERACEEAPVIWVRESHEVRLSQDALVDLLRYLLAFFRSHPKMRRPGRKGVAEDE
ncbi:hypothetical protein [Streptomyces capitiformicae]|uniref:Uncharacterized protein n=1 Tax=Streptomyces capitiformicae TaxID=2014920 RepID=A0A918ZW55_9ACTN|nr:hypothetical protein [Streptomyces capitiformicae]GHE71197.1 hypothetical protein GCM10017771_95180 [Streptomyces capitiformicae]